MATTIASLVVDLEARTGRLEQQLRQARQANRNFTRDVRRNYRQLGSQLNAVRLAATGAIAALAGGAGVQQIINTADEISKQARNVGFAVEAYQRWETALSLAGVGQRQFTVAATQVTRALGEANNGLASYQRAFEQLGLNYQELARQSPEQQFEAVLRALENTDDATVRASSGAVLLGRAWRQIGTVVMDGVDATLGAANGLTFVTEEAAQSAERFNDAWEIVGREVRARIINDIGGSLDQLTEVANGTIRAIVIGFNGLRIIINTISQAVRQIGLVLVSIGNTAIRLGNILGIVSDDFTNSAIALRRSLQEGIAQDSQDIADAWGNIVDELNSADIAAEVFEGTTQRVAQTAAEVETTVMDTVSAIDQIGMSAFDGLTDALTDFVTTGRLDLRSFVADAIRQFARLQISNALSGIIGGGTNLFSLFGRRQFGGPVAAGRPYLVGERGPEVFVPGNSGSIEPNNSLGGGTTTVNINAVDARSFQQLAASDPQFFANLVNQGNRQLGFTR